MSSSSSSKPSDTPPTGGSRLFHPILEQVPLPIRFVLSGVTGNAIFLIVYNLALSTLGSQYDAGMIFGVVQFGCIVLNHFLNVGIVFGWPADYLQSLLSNMPVGLTSLALGAKLASTLEQQQFDYHLKVMLGMMSEDDGPESAGGLFSSVTVMGVTGIYNYIMLNLINSNNAKKEETAAKEKKEL